MCCAKTGLWGEVIQEALPGPDHQNCLSPSRLRLCLHMYLEGFCGCGRRLHSTSIFGTKLYARKSKRDLGDHAVKLCRMWSQTWSNSAFAAGVAEDKSCCVCGKVLGTNRLGRVLIARSMQEGFPSGCFNFPFRVLFRISIHKFSGNHSGTN